MRNRDGTCQKRDKKISFWVPLISQPKLAHSQKNSKKIQKTKKHYAGFISSQIGLG